MSIGGRTEFEVVVTGVAAAETGLSTVAKAQDEVGAAALRADKLLERLESTFVDAAARARQLSASLESASRAASSLVDPATGVARSQNEIASIMARQSVETGRASAAVVHWGNAAQSAAQDTSALGKATDTAGKGMSLIMRAAYLLPGFGFAGILLAIGEAAKFVWDGMSGMGGATAEATREMEVQAALAQHHAEYLKKQAEAARDLGIAFTEAGRALAASNLGVAGTALSGRGILAGVEAESSLREIRDERKDLDAQAAELKKRKDELQRDRDRWAVGVGGPSAAWSKTLPAPRDMADLQKYGEIRRRTEELERDAAESRRAYNALRDREVDVRRALRLATGGDIGDGSKGSSQASERVKPVASADLMRPGFRPSLPGEQSIGDSWAAAEANRRAEEIGAARSEMALAHQAPGLDQDMERMREMQDLAQTMEDHWRSTGEAVKEFGVQFGQGMAHAAAAAILTGGSFKEMANALLKSLAVQAGAQALWESAKGIGNLALAAWGVPNAGAAATLHFQAAGMYAALAAAFAGGAAMSGGLRGGGAARGGGSGGIQNAGASNPYQPQGSGRTQVTVIIGSEVVTRGVHVEERRQAMRGGISEGRRAVA